MNYPKIEFFKKLKMNYALKNHIDKLYKKELNSKINNQIDPNNSNNHKKSNNYENSTSITKFNTTKYIKK